MLAEPDRLLLTAYVDGEISARQQRQLLKLLRRSGEARALLRQLQDHARALRQLPRAQLPLDLSDSVILLLRERRIKLRFRPAPARKSGLTVWAGFAAAAAVLLVACAGSYLLFANLLNAPNLPAVAHQGPPSKPKELTSVKPIEPRVNDNGDHKAPEQIAVMPKANANENPPIVQAPPPDDRKPTEPNPEKPIDPVVVTAPVTDLVELKMFDIAAPVIVKLQEVDQSATKTALLAEFNKGAGFRIEFPCRNGSRGFERLQAACKALDVTLHVDKDAVDRLKHPAFKSSYAIYLEDVTAEDLTRLLKQVAVEDAKKPDPKKVVEGQFDRIVTVQMSKRDRKELVDLLGTDPTTPAASAKGSDRLALAIPYGPFHPDAKSVEIKRYFDARKTARPGTLQVFLVIRDTSN